MISPETVAAIKFILETNKEYALNECSYAIELLENLPRLRYSQRNLYVGTISHPVIENFFRIEWSAIGIDSTHEYEFHMFFNN